MPTAVTFTAGTAVANPYGELAYLAATINAGWTVGDKWTASFSATSGDFTIGAGNVAGVTPTSLYIFAQRAFIGNGNQFNFSAVGDCTGWELQNIGAGFVSFTTSYGALDAVVGFAAYQGRLAVFGRRSIQVWQTNADPTQFSLVQTLTEVGCVASETIHSLGELDVLFLSDTGIRSLRVRDQSLNGIVIDLGSAINLLVQSVLLGLSDTQKAASCGIVEPSTNRYWFFLSDTIYVFSYFATSQILAWSTYVPSYQTANVSRFKNISGGTLRFWYGNSQDSTTMLFVDIASGATSNIEINFKYVSFSAVANQPSVFTSVADNFYGEIQGPAADAPAAFVGNQTLFVPTKFVVSAGRVYVRTASGVFLYGGTDNNTYDNAIATVETPWLSSKTPATVKSGRGVSVIMAGGWRILAGMDPVGQTLNHVAETGNAQTPDVQSDSTVQPPLNFNYTGQGTHFKLKAVSKPYGKTTFGKAVLSSFIFKYTEGKET